MAHPFAALLMQQVIFSECELRIKLFVNVCMVVAVVGYT